MDIDEFYAMPDDGSPTRHELVDGMAIAKELNTPTCGRLFVSLVSQILEQLKERKDYWAGLNVGVQPYIKATTNVRIAGIGVSNVSPKLEDRTIQSPVMLADIVTPASRKRVVRNAWSYVTIPSVQVILHVHSTRRLIEVFARQSNGDWPAEPVGLTSSTARCGNLDIDLPLDHIYGDILLDRTPTNDR
jgi:hypothetical protein